MASNHPIMKWRSEMNSLIKTATVPEKYILQQDFIRLLFVKYFISHFSTSDLLPLKPISKRRLLSILNKHIVNYGMSPVSRKDDSWTWFIHEYLHVSKSASIRVVEIVPYEEVVSYLNCCKT